LLGNTNFRLENRVHNALEVVLSSAELERELAVRVSNFVTFTFIVAGNLENILNNILLI
jgi:hypothetical protein